MKARFTFLIGLILIVSVNVLAQTSTPAPTKTPAPTETADDQPGDITQSRPFTQGDLSTLTGNVQRPNALQWYDNNIYAVCNGDWTIYKLDADTGSTETYIYGVRNGHAMYVESDENENIVLWIPDYDTNSLLRVSQQQAPETIAAGLEKPWGMTYLDEEHFLVTNLQGNTIQQISRDGEINDIVDGLRSPTGIVATDDYVFVANNGSARRSIEWFRRDEPGDDIELRPLVSGLQNATGMTTDGEGNLYFAYALGTRGVVGRVNPERCIEQDGCSNDEIEIVLYTELAAPLAGLTITPENRLYIHTIFRPEIYWVDLTSQVGSPLQGQ
jgi:hypothetical protein